MRLTEKEEKTVIMQKREEKTALKDEALEKATGGAAGGCPYKPGCASYGGSRFPGCTNTCAYYLEYCDREGGHDQEE